MSSKSHIFKNSKIVIGGSLNAVVYAFLKDLPIIFNEYQPPFPWEEWSLEYFNFFNFPFYKPRSFYMPNGAKRAGDYKVRIFEHLCYLLALGGKILGNRNVDTIRIEEQLLTVSYDSNKTFKSTFDNLVIFNPSKISGIEQKEVKELLVVDWFNVKHGAQHWFYLIETEDSFVNKIYFYLTPRVDCRRGMRDVVSVSHLEPKEINSIEYSELYAKLLVERNMKESGIIGYKRGFQRDGVTPRYAPPLVEHAKREIRKIYDLKQEVVGNIEFDCRTEEEIINQEEIVPSYMIAINQRLIKPQRQRRKRKKKDD